MSNRGYILLLIILGLIVYFNSLFNNFVWDDEEQILTNSLVHSISNISAFFTGSTFNTGGAGSLAGMYYKPMMSASFSFIYTLFGPNAFYFHLFQVVIHICNTVLIFLIFRYFFKNKESFVGSIIFLIHPSIAEAVIYISALQDILYQFFGLITFLFIINSEKNKKLIYFIPIIFLLSILSKETGFLYFPLLLLFVLLFQRKQFIKIFIALISSIAIYSFLRFIIAGVYFQKSGPSPIMRVSLIERLMTMPSVGFYYLKTFFFPKDLAIAQHWLVNKIDLNSFWLPLIGDFIFTLVIFFEGLYFYLRKQNFFKLYLFFVFWFISGMGLHLQIFPLDMTVAERWFYFPLIGLIGLILVFLETLKLEGFIKNLLLVLIIIILLALSVRTIFRNANFKDGLTLYEHDRTISINAYDLENNFGVELYRAGRTDEAAIHFETSTKLAPHWWTNWNNWGVIAENRGQIEDALIYYQKAIDNGKYYLAYENKAKTLIKIKRWQEAKDFIMQSLNILPLNSILWTTLAISEYNLGNQNEALRAAQNAYSLTQAEANLVLYQKISNKEPISK